VFAHPGVLRNSPTLGAGETRSEKRLGATGLIVQLMSLGVMLVVGCAASGADHKGTRIVEVSRGESSLHLVIDDGGRGADVFVDGTRSNLRCRRSGSHLRCHFMDLGNPPHRVTVEARGNPPLRCWFKKEGSKPRCKHGGFPVKRKTWYKDK
jgi:hypothetical protein